MKHSLSYDPADQLIVGKFEGTVTSHDVKDYINALYALVQEKGCFLIMNDFREAELNLSTLDIYFVPKLIEELFSRADIDVETYRKKVRSALLVINDTGDYHFFETVANNRLHNVRMFKDQQEAREWLFVK
jgi:hypothetical protein